MGEEDTSYVSISVRLPRKLVSIITKYGKERGLNFTDALKFILVDYFFGGFCEEEGGE